MKNIVIIGGSKGIGSAILLQQLENNKVYNISRTAPEVSHPNLVHFPIDILVGAFVGSLLGVIFGALAKKVINKQSITS